MLPGGDSAHAASRGRMRVFFTTQWIHSRRTQGRQPWDSRQTQLLELTCFLRETCHSFLVLGDARRRLGVRGHLNSERRRKSPPNAQNTRHQTGKKTHVCSVTGEAALVDLCWQRVCRVTQKIVPAVYVSLNDRECPTSIDFGVTNMFEQVGKSANTKSTNDEDGL